MATAGSIVVSLLLNTGSFETDTKRAERRLKDMEKSIDLWSKRITTSALAAGATFTAWAISVSRSMDATLKMAQQIGVTTEALTGLRYAAQQFANVSDQQFDMSMRRMTRRIEEAAKGSGAAKDAIAAMGLSAKELARLAPDQQLLAIADGMQKTERQAARLRYTMAIFDTEGVPLVNALSQGREEITKYISEAERFGLVLSTESALAAEKFQTQLSRLGAMLSGASMSMANNVLPVMGDFIENAINAWTETDELTSAVNELGQNTSLQTFLRTTIVGLGVLADVAVFAAKGIGTVVQSVDATIKGSQALLGLIGRPGALEHALDPEGAARLEAEYQQGLREATKSRNAAGTSIADLLNYRGDMFYQAAKDALAGMDYARNFVGPMQPITVFGNQGGGGDRATKSSGTDPLASFRARLAEAQELTAALQAYGLAVDDMLPSERELLKLQGQMGLAVKDRVGKLSDATLAAQIALTKETAAQEKLAKQLRQTLEMRKEYIDSILDQNAKAYTSITELEDRVATWALTDEQAARNVEELAQARVRERIALEESTLARQMLNGASQEEIAVTQQALAGLRQQLEYREREAELNETIRRQMEDRRAFERTVSQWTDTVRAIDDVFRVGFADMLNEGEGSWKAFTKSLASTFKTTVADTLYKAFAQPFVVRVVAQMAGLISGPAVGQQVLQQAGIGGGGGLGWMSNFGGNVTDSLWRMSEPLARMDGLLGDIGKGIFDNARAIGDFASTAGTAIGYGKAIYDITQGNWGSGIGTAIGTYVGGPVGAAVGSMLGGMLDGAFAGETRYGGSFMLDNGAAVRTGGPSGGAGAAETQFSQQLLLSATDALERAFAGANIDAAIANLTLAFESSDKGRGGTYSFGDLIIDGQTIRFGAEGKGAGHGGTSGSIEEVMANAEIDLWQTVIQGWQAAIDEFPRVMQDMIRGVDADSLGLEAAQALAQQFVAVIEQVNALSMALDMLPFAPAVAATFDFAAALAEAAGGAEAAANLLGSFYQNYYSEAERAAWLTEQLTAQLAELGLEFPRTREEFRAIVEANMALGEAGAQTVAALLGMESALSSLLPAFDAISGAAGSLDAAFEASLATARALAQESQRLLGVRNRAATTLDQIDRALGRTGQFGLQREAELWAVMATAGYEQQIDLAGELTTIVLGRIQAEIDANERLLELGRSLSGYIGSLSVGELSPLTLGQRTVEAERQLMESIARASAGDEEAMAQVQQQLDAALRLWREYGDYESAYARLTGAAGGLADRVVTDAERQLSVSSESLAQLEQLRGIAATATSAIDRLYQQSVAALAQETAQLSSLGQDTGRLHDIASLLGSMPAEIAARLQPMLDAAASSTVSGWYQGAGYGQGDAAGRDYWSQQLGSKPAGVVQNDFLNSLVTDWYTSQLGWAPDAAGLAYWVSEAERLGASRAHEDFLRTIGIHGSHRDGLWSVPFDGYRAELHRDEAVLPAVEARAWRAQQSDGGPSSAEVKALLERVLAAIEKADRNNVQVTVAAARDGSNSVVQGVGGVIREAGRRAELATRK